VNPGEPADPHRIPFFVGDDLDSGTSELPEEAVQVADSKIDHRGAIGGKVICVLLEWLEDHRSALVKPDPIVRLAVFVSAASPADAEMLAVPGFEHLRVRGPEKIAAHSDHRHRLAPPIVAASIAQQVTKTEGFR